jgi:uncharacterized membrane protein YfcA
MVFDIEYIWFFMILLPVVSFLYSSVGHGGASGYLALMALFSFPTEVMKPTALILNLFVSGIAFFYYFKEGYFNKKLFFYFALTSIPFAYLGGTLEVDATLYKIILSILLIFAVLKMLNVFGKDHHEIREIRLWQGLLIGSVIGFFSGLIGIGGGIILTPVILILHWGKMKEAAAVSALFIWVNSASGLIGQISIGVEIPIELYGLIAIAIAGGILGGYLGSKRINNLHLRYVLAIVLAIASVKLLMV